MKTKKCTKCNIEKDLNQFFKAKTGKFGVRGDCKECVHKKSEKIIQKEKLFCIGLKKCVKCQEIKSLDKFYNDKSNKDKISYWCGQCLKNLSKKYRCDNKEKIRIQRKKADKIYYIKNKKRIIQQQIKQRRIRRQTDINFKLLYNLRSRLTLALQGKLKSKRTLELLGCTVEELKQYLESKFTEGMTWDNHGYGSDKWHIDHIKPCSKFNFSYLKQQELCFNYTNLQPLWQNDNFKKSDNYEFRKTNKKIS